MKNDLTTPSSITTHYVYDTFKISDAFDLRHCALHYISPFHRDYVVDEKMKCVHRCITPESSYGSKIKRSIANLYVDLIINLR
jgi:hypothetical protein